MARKRPGRKLSAEKRRIAREHLRIFSTTNEWQDIPAVVRVAIKTLVPEIKKEKE